MLLFEQEWRNNYAQKSYTHVHDGEYLEAIKKSEEEPSMLTLVEVSVKHTAVFTWSGRLHDVTHFV